jgi:hypothetical protein
VATMLISATQALPQKTQILNISVIIDYPDHFEQLVTWLTTVNAQNFTFVIQEQSKDAILSNQTRINILKAHGEIIPRIADIQTQVPDSRINTVVSIISEFNRALNTTIKGVFDFIPDTYTANYLVTQGITYYQGYCFDQWKIDYMSMRGGLQMPYYASSQHVNIPSNNTTGIVILPHASWDWSASFTVTHNLQLHPVNVIDRIYNGNTEYAQSYFIQLLDRSMQASEPFGYQMIQFEWDWAYREGVTDQFATIINAVQTRPYPILTCSDTVDWFKTAYSQGTPAYSIDFTSPYNNQRIEWYSNTEFRVARIDQIVVSFVNYTDQTPDRYLTNYASINWAAPSNSSENGIDNSLTFAIDALGGAEDRHSITTDGYPYTGSLADFQNIYQPIDPKTDPNQHFLPLLIITVIILILFFVRFRQQIQKKGMLRKIFTLP